jgi:hypothetical protein
MELQKGRTMTRTQEWNRLSRPLIRTWAPREGSPVGAISTGFRLNRRNRECCVRQAGLNQDFNLADSKITAESKRP